MAVDRGWEEVRLRPAVTADIPAGATAAGDTAAGDTAIGLTDDPLAAEVAVASGAESKSIIWVMANFSGESVQRCRMSDVSFVC